MKTIVLSLCVVSLLIPVTSAAEQSDFTPLVSMLTAGTISMTSITIAGLL